MSSAGLVLDLFWEYGAQIYLSELIETCGKIGHVVGTIQILN